MTKLGKLVFTAILVAILFIVLFFLQRKPTVEAPDISERESIQSDTLGNKDDLVSFSILPNAKMRRVVSYRNVVIGNL